jgi:hypothetical protein
LNRAETAIKALKHMTNAAMSKSQASVQLWYLLGVAMFDSIVNCA